MSDLLIAALREAQVSRHNDDYTMAMCGQAADRIAALEASLAECQARTDSQLEMLERGWNRERSLRGRIDQRDAEAEALEAQVERLKAALVRARGHTSHVEAVPKQLHIDLLASIERIVDAALAEPSNEQEGA